jgi:multisubunit Na+/H+ antiporter MnhG subunit
VSDQSASVCVLGVLSASMALSVVWLVGTSLLLGVACSVIRMSDRWKVNVALAVVFVALFTPMSSQQCTSSGVVTMIDLCWE